MVTTVIAIIIKASNILMSATGFWETMTYKLSNLFFKHSAVESVLRNGTCSTRNFPKTESSCSIDVLV